MSAKLGSLVPFSCAALFLIDAEAETVRCRFATGTDADIIQRVTVRSGEGLTGWVASNRRPLVNARPSADLEAAGMKTGTQLQSALVCPLLYNERFIGTLAVYHVDAAFYRDDHRRLLDRISEQAAAVINNSMLFEETQEDALTDPLTGLPNERFLFMHLARELARAARLKSELSILMMDMDDFRGIKDRFGRYQADRVLRDVAGILRASMRPYDIVVHQSRDEFICVLSGCGATEADDKRAEMQNAVDQMNFEVERGRRLALGMSIGSAVFPHDGDGIETLFGVAEERLAQDKARRKRARSRGNA
jgi:diguanylate cyclase (GGDEF)-like protein